MDRLGLFEIARAAQGCQAPSRLLGGSNFIRLRGCLTPWLICSVTAFCGCQSQGPTDPFMNRATIPPPGTSFAPPPGGQPYYTPPVTNNTRPPAMQPNYGRPAAAIPPTLPPNTYPTGAMPSYPAQGYPAQGYNPAYPHNVQPAPNGIGATPPMGSGLAPQNNPQFNGNPGVIANPGGSPSWSPNTSPVGTGTPAFNSGSAVPNYPANRNPFAWQQQNPNQNPNAVPTGYAPYPTSWPANGVAAQPGTPANMPGYNPPMNYSPPTASIPDNALVRVISPRAGATSTPSVLPSNVQAIPVSTPVSNPPIVTIPAASVPSAATSNATNFQEPRRLDNTVTSVDMSDLRPVKSTSSSSGATIANRPTSYGTPTNPTTDIPLVPRNDDP